MIDRLKHGVGDFLSGGLGKGDLFTYSMSTTPEFIRQDALKAGGEVEYMPPGTKEYQQYGSMVMRVIKPVKRR